MKEYSQREIKEAKTLMAHEDPLTIACRCVHQRKVAEKILAIAKPRGWTDPDSAKIVHLLEDFT